MSIFAQNKNKIMGLFGLFSNKKKETLDKGLEKTKESVFGKLARAVAGKSTVDDDVLDAWEYLSGKLPALLDSQSKD